MYIRNKVHHFSFWCVLGISILLSACGGASSGGGSTNHAPVANAGSDQNVATSSIVTLDGSGSTDADGDTLAYNWSFTSKPAASAATLSSSTVKKPTFTPDVDGSYIFSLVVNDGTVDSTAASVTITSSTNSIASSSLNDTGITWGGNYPAGNNTTCIGETVAQQDCSQGRDAQAVAGMLNKVGGGVAGFDFTKLDASGAALVNQQQSYATQPWSCVKDNHTGLIWEVKTTAGSSGIHDANNSYRWGGKTAQPSSDGNANRYNDWNTLVDGTNTESLCGFNGGWRLPTVDELQGLVNYGRVGPAIDIDYFPNTSTALFYWTASPYAKNSFYAWNVYAGDGSVGHDFREDAYQVRLVRSGQ